MPAAAIQEMKNEIELWTPLQNDGIVKLFYSSLSPVPLLVLEACDGGTLFGAIRRGAASPPPPLRAAPPKSPDAATRAPGPIAPFPPLL